MKFNIKISTIICLFFVCQSYGMDSNASNPQASSASTLATISNQQDEWAQYLQQEHEAHLKLRIFQTTETILKQFGVDPKKIHVVVTKSGKGSTWATDTKTIFIDNEAGEESANQHLRCWLLYNVDCFVRGIAFFERNSVALGDLKKTILRINHQVIEDLLNRKEYSAIASNLLGLLSHKLNGTGRTYPYPTSQEEYDSTVQQLKDCGCTIELAISEQSATSTSIELKFQKILSHTMDRDTQFKAFISQQQLSVITVSQNFSLPIAQVYALLYPETRSSASSRSATDASTAASSSSTSSSSSSSASSESTITTNTSAAITACLACSSSQSTNGACLSQAAQ